MKHPGMWLLVLLALVGTRWSVEQLGRPAAPAAPRVEWDPRLDDLNVTLQPAASCGSGCWRLMSARFEDFNESGGQHHIWARALNGDGTQRGGEPWRVFWPGGEQPLTTKPAPDWADFGMYGPGGCFNPDVGPGPFTAQMGGDPARSDLVVGMGLPQCQHVNFRLTWQWVASDSPSPTATSVPPTRTATRAATRTPAPATATATPLLTSTPLPTATLAPTATPAPGEETVARIGPEGGALQLWDAAGGAVITLVVPPGAVPTTGWLHVLPRPDQPAPPRFFLIGQMWEWWITLDDGSRAQPGLPVLAEQTFRYDARPDEPLRPALFRWDGTGWAIAARGQTTLAVATGQMDKPAIVGVMYEGHLVHLPLMTR